MMAFKMYNYNDISYFWFICFLSLLMGCAYSVPREIEQKARLVQEADSEMVRHCDCLGIVRAGSYDTWTAENAAKNAKFNAYTLGATHIVWDEYQEYILQNGIRRHGYVKGKAYKCDKSIKADNSNPSFPMAVKGVASSENKYSNRDLRINSEKRWAVIIGVSNYQDSRIPSLRYANQDAKAFYNWIVSPQGGRYAPSRVKLLLDKDVTNENMKYALFVWLKQALEEDVVLIFFAGHGAPESPDSQENLFLLPYDAKYDNISISSFPMWDIEIALKKYIKSKKVVVIADACHSGGIGAAFDVTRRSNRGILDNSISSSLQNLSKTGDGIAIISASDNKQLSQEGKKWGGGHGVFTYYLLKGLKGEADYNHNNTVTLGELIPYLSEYVRRATGSGQSPTVAGRFDPALSIGK